MGTTKYEFIRFRSPRAQTGVVVAYPPGPECPMPPMVVAVAWELQKPNPVIRFANGPTTYGMAMGVCGAVMGASLGEFEEMWDRHPDFWYSAHVMGINIDGNKSKLVTSIQVPEDLFFYLREELESYEEH